jgi:predicted DNA repair protein MutK
MKKFWKNFLIVVSLVLLSAGVTYLMVSKLSDRLVNLVKEQTINQSEQAARLVKAEVVPAIETDFTHAAEQTVHTVVHIASKTMRSAAIAGLWIFLNISLAIAITIRSRNPKPVMVRELLYRLTVI